MLLFLRTGLSAPKFTVAQYYLNLIGNRSFIKLLKLQCEQIFRFISCLETQVVLFKLLQVKIKICKYKQFMLI